MSMDATPQDGTRKPYATPRLAVYGDLRDLTQNNVTVQMNDKGNGSASMT